MHGVASQTVHSPSDEVFDVHVDTDFAGCGQTRGSTSGGIVMCSGHCVKHYSVTQSTLCPSSGESELHGISKGVSTGIGMQSIAKDPGFDVSVLIHRDACAAIGITRKHGLGKLRHLDVEDLWVQQKNRDRSVDLVKVLGNENPAEILTTNVAVDLLSKMLQHIGMVDMDGRASAAPELPKEQ